MDGTGYFLHSASSLRRAMRPYRPHLTKKNPFRAMTGLLAGFPNKQLNRQEICALIQHSKCLFLHCYQLEHFYCKVATPRHWHWMSRPMDRIDIHREMFIAVWTTQMETMRMSASSVPRPPVFFPALLPGAIASIAWCLHCILMGLMLTTWLKELQVQYQGLLCSSPHCFLEPLHL